MVLTPSSIHIADQDVAAGADEASYGPPADGVIVINEELPARRLASCDSAHLAMAAGAPKEPFVLIAGQGVDLVVARLVAPVQQVHLPVPN
jgi:hypothetical protein